MAMENVVAKFQVKDTEGNVVLDDDGKVVMEECAVQFDFGDDLNAAVDLCGEEAVHSNYKANAKVQLQAIIRAKLKAGNTPDSIQAIVANWVPGMVMEKTAIDPVKAVENAYATWSSEKKLEFIARLEAGGSM